MCVSELMIALGQADLCGKFTYGSPELMSALGEQMDHAVAVAKAGVRHLSGEQLWAEGTEGTWQARPAEALLELVSGVYERHHKSLCESVATELARCPDTLLPTDEELRALEERSDGVTCRLDGARFITRVSSGGEQRRLLPGVVMDAVLAGPQSEGVKVTVDHPQAESRPPWSTPPKTWVEAGMPWIGQLGQRQATQQFVHVGLPMFSKR